MAARSLRFTARTLCPTLAAGASSGKCTSATNVSTHKTTASPGAGRTSAASSPTPSSTSSRRAPKPRKYRAIRSNSPLATRASGFHIRQLGTPIAHRLTVRAPAMASVDHAFQLLGFALRRALAERTDGLKGHGRHGWKHFHEMGATGNPPHTLARFAQPAGRDAQTFQAAVASGRGRATGKGRGVHG